MLKTKLCEVEFENPLILAGGIMGSTASSLNRILNAGAGAAVTKSFSIKANKGYSIPTTIEVNGGIINAIGLSNPGLENFREELKILKNLKTKGKICIASIYGSNPEDFSYLAGEIDELVDMIELNVSCPHAMAGCGAAIGQDPDLTKKIVSSAKKASKVPIIVKLTPNVTDIVEIAISAQKGGADAITLINSLGPGMEIDIQTGHPILSNKFGGMSGPAIKPIALRCVWEVFNNCKIPILGVGGISNYKDVVEFLYAGSTAIQIGTAIMYEGIGIFSKIATDLKNFMEKNDFKSIDSMIGYSHRI